MMFANMPRLETVTRDGGAEEEVQVMVSVPLDDIGPIESLPGRGCVLRTRCGRSVDGA